MNSFTETQAGEEGSLTSSVSEVGHLLYVLSTPTPGGPTRSSAPLDHFATVG